MALNYQWRLKGIKKQSNCGLANIIIQTNWEVTGTDEDGLSGTFSGATPFDPSEVYPNNFTKYENLTEQQVLGWVRDRVEGPSGYIAHIIEQIEIQINRKKTAVEDVEAGSFPWDTPTENSNNSIE